MTGLSLRKLDNSAVAQIAQWTYPEPYSIYRFDFEEPNLEDGLFGIYDHDELVAYRSFGADGRVPGWDYDDSHLDTGGGMRPDLTGKGMGQRIVLAGLQFGARLHSTTRFRVTIAKFNNRAQIVCRRIGFRQIGTFKRSSDHMPFTVFTIDLNDGNTETTTTPTNP